MIALASLIFGVIAMRMFLAGHTRVQLRHWPANLLAMLGISVLCVSCMTQSKIPDKRDPIYDEAMRLAARWEQCFREQQSIQMAEVEEGLCGMIRGDFQKFTDGLASSENLTRICSAGTLGFSKDPRAIPYLIASLNDPLEEVRTNALFSLAFMKDPSTP
ncbi:MAG: HEAT repeat domain-containing protein, partial [Planctomycetota bacterium]|nr:HEAT repeat domain-containing protein [Planctomycetota bacterium]